METSTSREEHFHPFLKHQNFTNIFRTLSQHFSAELSKGHSTCPEKHFATINYFLEKKYSHEFSLTLLEQFSGFEQKVLGRVVKNAFYESIEIFWDFCSQKNRICSLRIGRFRSEKKQPEGKISLSQFKLGQKINIDFQIKWKYPEKAQ